MDRKGEGGVVHGRGTEGTCDEKQGKGRSQSLEFDWKDRCGGG